jgi:REP element-mobilizing transposase RayT
VILGGDTSRPYPGDTNPASDNRAKELFEEIAEYHGFEIEEMEVAADHVHIFVSHRSIRYRR